MSGIKNTAEKLEKFKYPILILILGLILMLLPSHTDSAGPAVDGDAVFQQILSSTEGVGEAKVIVSENGVVVVCRGGDNAAVRLEIIKAIGSYTGFGSDKITVLKMAD